MYIIPGRGLGTPSFACREGCDGDSGGDTVTTVDSPGTDTTGSDTTGAGRTGADTVVSPPTTIGMRPRLVHVERLDNAVSVAPRSSSIRVLYEQFASVRSNVRTDRVSS